MIPFIYYRAFPFTEGRAQVQKDIDGKFGYIDKTGDVVIPLIYDEGWAFHEGRAWVKKGGENFQSGWFYIDKQGNRLD